jgi:predicted alpha/beta hydrolase family esterase
MQQILHIHGGETFRNYKLYFEYLKKYSFDLNKFEKKKTDWTKHLQKDLGNNYQVISPAMPNPRNAKYAEWKIWLEKFFPCLKDDIILTSKSLGGIFWAKYLSENKFPVKISQLHLVAAPFNNNDPITPKGEDYDLIDFNHQGDLSLIEKQVDQIYLHHSQDDPVVTFDALSKFSKALPSAKVLTYTDRGHFSIEQFPEILTLIKKTR